MKASKLKSVSLAVAAAVTMFSGSAQADSLQTDLNSLGVSTGLIFSVEIDGASSSGREAGSFNITNVTEGTNFAAFCADIRTGIAATALGPTGIEYTELSASAFITDPTQLQNVQTLFDQRYGSVDLTSAVQTAAFQISFWELLDDGALGSGSVVWGSALAGSDNATALALADDWLKNLSDPTVGSNSYDLTVWDRGGLDPNSQPYIQATAAPGGSVPEPGTLMLGLAGLAGLGLMRRKS